MTALPPAAQSLAERQLGVVTRAQLIAAGVSSSTIEWHTGRAWRYLLPRVILLDRILPTPDQRQVAALLLAGPDSVLAGATAAAAYGLTTCATGPPIHVLVPRPRRSRDVAWVSIRRTTVDDPARATRGPMRLSCLPRAVVDAAAESGSERQAAAIVIEAVQRRLVRLDDLHHWAAGRGSRGSGRVRRAIEVASTGVWSTPESDLLRLIRRSKLLPEPWANPRLIDGTGARLTTPDLWFDDVALAVMVHSRQVHAGVLDWEATVESDASLLAAGVIVIPVTPASIRGAADRVLVDLEHAYCSVKARGGRPAVRAAPQSPPRLGG